MADNVPINSDLTYLRFSDAEMARRRRALDAAMAKRGVEHIVLYGANRVGSAVEWLTEWPVTREALVIHTPEQVDTLLVNFYNHVPNAKRMAATADVRWGGLDMADSAVDELRQRRAAGRPIGVIGPLGHFAYGTLARGASSIVEMQRDYTRLRLIKSEEEIACVRIAARMTDDAMRSLYETAAPGVDEYGLSAIVERSYLAAGGTTHIHYFGATPMTAPVIAVPAQWPSTRELQRKDALFCEISAAFRGYSAQLLRTFTVAAEPTALYRELHDVADGAFDAVTSRLRAGATAADLFEASRVIEDAGFTIRDDLVHGFVGGYFPPVLGSRSRAHGPVPDFTFAAGMTVVVQPNIVTRDETAGVQTGELLLVTDSGVERLHNWPRGLLRIC